MTCTNEACGKATTGKRPNGWCDGCYLRWLRAGKPASGPPAPRRRQQRAVTEGQMEASRDAMRSRYETRLATFRDLADKGLGNTQIARQMGVTTRTIHRYRTVYKPLRLPYEERLTEFRRLTAEGMPVRQIAMALNLAVTTVQDYRRAGKKEGWL